MYSEKFGDKLRLQVSIISLYFEINISTGHNDVDYSFHRLNRRRVSINLRRLNAGVFGKLYDIAK
jgi:hypothetical protein